MPPQKLNIEHLSTIQECFSLLSVTNKLDFLKVTGSIREL